MEIENCSETGLLPVNRIKKIFLIFLLLVFPLICQSENFTQKSTKDINELIEKLGSSDIIENYQAGKEIIKEGETAIPYLIKSLNHQKSKIRFASIILLEQLKAKESIPEFINILKDKSRKDKERTACALALGRLNAKDTSDVLIETLNDDSTSIKTACIVSLGMLKEEKAVPYLLRYVKDKEKQIGQVTLKALKEIGDNGVPKLEEIFERGEFEEKLLALEVLGEIKSEKSIEFLKKTMKNENKYLSISSAYILSSIGKSDGKEVAKKLLNDKDPKIKTLADKTLQNIKNIEDNTQKLQ